MGKPAVLEEVNVELNLGAFKIGGVWKADANQQQAAWELYVELITRIAIQELRPDEGMIREALNSLYALFGKARDILREHGPSIAKPAPGSTLSFGQLTLTVLNMELRPFLAKWHPLLSDHEAGKPAGISSFDHERKWVHNDQARAELRTLQENLDKYSTYLAKAAGVDPIHMRRPD
jgi:hypothetical protein